MNFPDLAKLLEARIAVIADHEFRDRDPAAHLEALKNVSEAIVSWHETHRFRNLSTSSVMSICAISPAIQAL